MAGANDRTCTVYGLFSSGGGCVRYVGQTTGDVATRARKHIERAIRKCTKPTHREAWIRKVVADGFRVKWVVLQNGAAWNTDEIRWIRKLRREGVRLVNGTRGGEGMLDAPAALRQRIGDRLKELWADPEYRERMKAAHAGAGWSDARRAAYKAGEAQRRSDSGKVARSKIPPERRSEIASIAARAGKALRASKRAQSEADRLQAAGVT